MSWKIQLRNQPLRTKVAITVIGVGVAVLGLSTYLSFQYWQQEARAVAEQQALLAAVSTRVSVEAALNGGNQPAAQHALAQLLRNAAVHSARVYGPDGRVLLSAHEEEVGARNGRIWIPRGNELPRDGVARTEGEDHEHSVHAFVPVGSSLENVLEIEFSLAAVEQAMKRGARLGVGLLIASLFALAVILYAMLDREVAQLTRKGESASRLAEQRRMQLEQREGFAEVGELAAEMAHEFKRPLAAIRTAIQVLEQEYTLTGDGQRLLLGIEGQLERLSDTMRDVFGLARPVTVEQESISVHDALDNALFQLAETLNGSAISVRREYGTSVPPLRGDARRLEVAFLNLMNNAAEAMPKGGTLTVRVSADAAAVDISFTDTGCGIDQAEIPNVMKPFYSTKATGTGLGLPLVARIVAAHRGQLLIESDKGHGTTVHVRLPLTIPGETEPENSQWALQESSSSMTTISSVP